MGGEIIDESYDTENELAIYFIINSYLNIDLDKDWDEQVLYGEIATPIKVYLSEIGHADCLTFYGQMYWRKPWWTSMLNMKIW